MKQHCPKVSITSQPCGVLAGIAQIHTHTYTCCKVKTQKELPNTWLGSFLCSHKGHKAVLLTEGLLASKKTLAEERAAAKTKKCSNCVKLATALMLGH